MASGKQQNDREKDSEETTGITIRVSGANLPDDADKLDRIVNNLGHLVGRALCENYGIRADRVIGSTGPEYSQIENSCPECEHGSLRLTDFNYNWEGVTAIATCDECRWVGLAIYRLTDYKNRTGDWESAVKSGRRKTHYHEY